MWALFTDFGPTELFRQFTFSLPGRHPRPPPPPTAPQKRVFPTPRGPALRGRARARPFGGEKHRLGSAGRLDAEPRGAPPPVAAARVKLPSPKSSLRSWAAQLRAHPRSQGTPPRAQREGVGVPPRPRPAGRGANQGKKKKKKITQTPEPAREPACNSLPDGLRGNTPGAGKSSPLPPARPGAPLPRRQANTQESSPRAALRLRHPHPPAHPARTPTSSGVPNVRVSPLPRPQPHAPSASNARSPAAPRPTPPARARGSAGWGPPHAPIPRGSPPAPPLPGGAPPCPRQGREEGTGEEKAATPRSRRRARGSRSLPTSGLPPGPPHPPQGCRRGCRCRSGTAAAAAAATATARPGRPLTSPRPAPCARHLAPPRPPPRGAALAPALLRARPACPPASGWGRRVPRRGAGLPGAGGGSARNQLRTRGAHPLKRPGGR